MDCNPLFPLSDKAIPVRGQTILRMSISQPFIKALPRLIGHGDFKENLWISRLFQQEIGEQARLRVKRDRVAAALCQEFSRLIAAECDGNIAAAAAPFAKQFCGFERRVLHR